MFTALQSRVSNNQDPNKSSDGHSVNSVTVAKSVVGSNESLNSTLSTTGSLYRKSSRIKHLEDKVNQLGTLLRQKNLSIETSNKEIQKLRAELEHIHTHSVILPSDIESNNAPESTTPSEKQSHLTTKLSKAEADLQTVNQLSDEIMANKDKLLYKANLELNSLTQNLDSSKEELKTLRLQLTEKVADIESLNRRLALASKELEVKSEAIECEKATRLKFLEDKSVSDKAFRRLEIEKEDCEKKNLQLKTTIDQLNVALCRQEQLAAESSDQAASNQVDAEKSRMRAASAETRAAEREADLKDRIRFLEQRLVLLTEPDSALFADHVEEAKLSTSSTTTEEDTDLAGSAAARCITLLVERKLLETRLFETRKHLEEVKSTWNEKLSALESQITHLNGKIAEDSVEHAAAQTSWASQRAQLELQLAEVRKQCHEAEAVSSELQSDCAMHEESRRQWDLERASLLARLAAGEETAETESRVHTVALQTMQELQSRIGALEKEVAHWSGEVDALKRERSTLEDQIKTKHAELEQLQLNNQTLQLAAERSQERVCEIERELAQLTSTNADLNTQLAGCTQLLHEERDAVATQVLALKTEVTELKEQRDAAASQLADVNRTVEMTESAHQQLECELTTLQGKVYQLEQERKEMLAGLETARTQGVHLVAKTTTLEGTVENLNAKINEQNQTIRLQKQKLVELKRALSQGLRATTASNLSLASTVDDIQNHRCTAVLSLVAATAAVDEVIQSSLPVTGQQSVGPLNVSSPRPLSSDSPAVLPSQTLRLASRQVAIASPSSSLMATMVNAPSDLDTVNFGYLRHVILKFLLSRDSEALQLVRAVSAILRLSEKDEFLIRQKLEQRQSWFVSTVASPTGSGQFAKIVSP